MGLSIFNRWGILREVFEKTEPDKSYLKNIEGKKDRFRKKGVQNYKDLSRAPPV